MTARAMTRWLGTAVALALALAAAEAAGGMEGLDFTGVHGGLVVHLGCGDGKLTAGLRLSDSDLVHGLDTDASNIETARAHIRSLGLYGKVAVDRFDGRKLPYIDNLVNLLVAEHPGDVPVSEVMRVLCPGGVAYVKLGDRWVKRVKPRPDAMDEWPHYLHDPQGTMVSRDRIVGLPRRLQWVGGPKWLRNHDFMASLNGMVSSGGRIFYIIDEGLRSHIYLPARWVVVARDAFNGTILWKRPIDLWFPHTWPFKSGPGHLPRRIVADGDRVYVTLGLTAPLSVLDAATGETIRTYDQTKATEEIVLSDGVLYLLVDPDKRPFAYQHASSNRGSERTRVNREFGWSKESPERLLTAVSADTGEVLWQRSRRVAPLTLAMDDETVFFHDGEHVVALDRRTGEEKWVSEAAGQWANPATGYAARLIVGDGVVVVSNQQGRGGRLVGVSSDTGEVLWKSEQLKSGHWSPEDLFLIHGVVWTAQTGKSQTQGTRFQAVDAKTGQTKQDFVAEYPETFFMHQRCYPGRATERYIMTSGTGTEFLEVGTQHCELHHWLRGACIYGLMPGNGLLYKAPDSCACYYQSKLPHFCAMAPPSDKPTVEAAREDRLEKGPAYEDGKELAGEIDAPASGCWPTYRCDAARSGATQSTVSPELQQAWRADVGGRLSTMTAAWGRLFVSEIDRHAVHALAADSGKTLWSYATGGRVDSPPTIWGRLAVFGCADGWVYCLRASDGELVWRFRAAPGDEKLVSYGQVESVWPLHGSVLVRDGVAYCLAGRNMFVDGGMRLVRLACATGDLLSETVLDDKDPRTGENLQTLIAGKSMPVANAGLFSCDDGLIYMGAEEFDLQGNRVQLEVALGKEREQTGEGRHLFCPTGFLDDAWFHRSYWIYGKNAGEGHGEYPVPRSHTPCGRIMVFDDSRVYAFIAQNVGNNINPRTSYSLYAADKDAASGREAAAAETEATGKKRRRRPASKPGKGIPHIWELEKPGLLANAMVLAGRNLFLTGPPDVADEEKTFGFVYGADDEIHRQMRSQEEAWQGKRGALVWVVSADTGEKLSEHKLPAIPVWDGMIAAGGRLYAALQDGTVLCLSGR
jgi:outer membrane protein assembly factor BamB